MSKWINISKKVAMKHLLNSIIHIPYTLLPEEHYKKKHYDLFGYISFIHTSLLWIAEGGFLFTHIGFPNNKLIWKILRRILK